MEKAIHTYYNALGGKPMVVSVDHSWLIKKSPDEKEKLNTLYNTVEMLMRVKNELPIIVLMITQLNRSIDEPARKTPGSIANFPTSSDIFGGDALMQGSDMVLVLTRPYKADIPVYGPKEYVCNKEDLFMHIIKSRNGSDDTNLIFIRGDFNKQKMSETIEPASNNPTGRFVIGGPDGDTGLTGRKIIVDTYGGRGAHGGGAFSGKDPSKVDRSAAYATRHIAKNLVAAGLADEVLVQVSYAIGVAKPTSINVNTYGTAKVDLSDGEIGKIVEGLFDMRPYFIEQRLKLRNPIYSETAAYGHMGRKNEVVTKTFRSPNGKDKKVKVELFTWEKLDYVSKVKKAFAI
jgi:hypothetical protein